MTYAGRAFSGVHAPVGHNGTRATSSFHAPVGHDGMRAYRATDRAGQAFFSDRQRYVETCREDGSKHSFERADELRSEADRQYSEAMQRAGDAVDTAVGDHRPCEAAKELVGAAGDLCTSSETYRASANEMMGAAREQAADRSSSPGNGGKGDGGCVIS
jgi:hypothetical protein